MVDKTATVKNFMTDLAIISWDLLANASITDEASIASRKSFLEKLNTGFLEPQAFILGDHLELIRTGAFKECYDMGFGNHVIKFCTEHNQTEGEKELLKSAKEFGVGKLFLNTIFLNLPESLYSYHIDPENAVTYDCENHDYAPGLPTNAMLTQCEIQPKVDISRVLEEDYNNIPSEEYYDVDPLILPSGRQLTFDEFLDLGGCANLKWLRMVIAEYKEEGFNKFVDFIKGFGISDLHNGNIGYQTVGDKVLPVIVDWLSCPLNTKTTYWS